MLVEDAAELFNRCSTIHIKEHKRQNCKHMHFTFMIVLYMKDIDALRHLAGDFGAVIGEHHDRCYINGTKAAMFLAMIRPYVCEAKRVQVRIASDFAATYGYSPLLPEHVQQRRKCILEMQAYRKHRPYGGNTVVLDVEADASAPPA